MEGNTRTAKCREVLTQRKEWWEIRYEYHDVISGVGGIFGTVY
jgi:hypothetical protein